MARALRCCHSKGSNTLPRRHRIRSVQHVVRPRRAVWTLARRVRTLDYNSARLCRNSATFFSFLVRWLKRSQKHELADGPRILASPIHKRDSEPSVFLVMGQAARERQLR